MKVDKLYFGYGGWEEVSRRIQSLDSADKDVVMDGRFRGVTRQSDITFANAIAENAVAGRGSVGNVVGVDEAD